MSITKTTTASASYINAVADIAAPSTALNYTPVVEGVVYDGQIKPGDRVARPGVFTAGTTPEGSIAQYSSNG